MADSLQYDGWERLTDKYRCYTKPVHFCGHVESFSYDRTGNIKTSAGETYDATTDRLTTASGCTYRYDGTGNDTSVICGANTWTYQYDALRRLRSARYNGTLIVRYGYDVLGRRIVKRVYSSSTGGTVAYTRFVYRGGVVGFETDSGGTITLKYTWGPAADDLLAIEDNAGGHYYVVQDKLHSVRGLVRRDGTWIRSLSYLSYGGLGTDSSVGGPSLRYRWTGREYDSETGLYFFRARYYDPSVRRFVQEDPIGYGGGGNVYAYGNGGPLEGRDPGGMEMSPDALIPIAPSTPITYQDDWRYVSDQHGGGDWMPPGLNGAQQAAFVDGVLGMGNIPVEVVIITGTYADGNTASVEMKVYHSDFNPDIGNEFELATAAADAAVLAGISEFGVSAFTSGDHNCCAHSEGRAMDIVELNGVNVRALAGSDPNLILGFVGALESNPSVPVSAQILGPLEIGDYRTASGWVSIPDYMDRGGDYLGHGGHIHFQWNTR
jgi:RHS repeat-associated protein